ncbi:ThuA domain-containing protein [Microbacterium invictum]|uniref:ThuA domain-containing protein n=1 Tax=Microbacterium invictum TaxID=515415 RepID=A0ABZ0VBH8_9MICO|nr:ThuA domain-containing protein [Microbacterium invictum]WQB70701.1 ThuA domain-containing protein [Microbacterium invictum]
MRALIISGSGRYADPWHPFLATSQKLAEVLIAAGADCTIDDDVEGALARAADFDLVVVNAGDPWRGESEHAGARPEQVSLEGFARALHGGIGVLAIHSAVSSLRDYPEWALAVGRVWLPGISSHPPADVARITGGVFPDGEPVQSFEVFDERYCRLQPVGRIHAVATHLGPWGQEPTAWVTEHGRARIAADLLGHDERSYDSPDHRLLVTQLAAWASRQ